MTSLLVLIPVSLGMGLIGLGAFFWAMRHDQFDDPDGNAWRIIETEMAEDRGDHIAAQHHGPDKGPLA